MGLEAAHVQRTGARDWLGLETAQHRCTEHCWLAQQHGRWGCAAPLPAVLPGPRLIPCPRPPPGPPLPAPARSLQRLLAGAEHAAENPYGEAHGGPARPLPAAPGGSGRAGAGPGSRQAGGNFCHQAARGCSQAARGGSGGGGPARGGRSCRAQQAPVCHAAAAQATQCVSTAGSAGHDNALALHPSLSCIRVAHVNCNHAFRRGVMRDHARSPAAAAAGGGSKCRSLLQQPLTSGASVRSSLASRAAYLASVTRRACPPGLACAAAPKGPLRRLCRAFTLSIDHGSQQGAAQRRRRLCLRPVVRGGTCLRAAVGRTLR